LGQETGPEKIPAGPSRPDRAVLAFTRKELKIFRSMRPGGRELKPIFGLTELTAWPDLILAGPILGAPQAAMVLEHLSRRGVRTFLSLGWCGSLRPELVWGDIVLPVSALSEEGTSAHYPLQDGPAGADPELAGRLTENLNELGYKFRDGRVWSTDAPFRETRDKAKKYAADGMLAVDMETSALMTVARFRGLAWAGLLVVSDELWGEKWRPGFESAELEDGLTKAARAVLAAAGPAPGGSRP